MLDAKEKATWQHLEHTQALLFILSCQHTQSFSWQSMTHVSPTYQTKVSPRLLITSAEAEQAKRNKRGLGVGLLLAVTLPEGASSSFRPFEKKDGIFALLPELLCFHDEDLALLDPLDTVGHKAAISIAAPSTQL